jgi:hypothetical protein
MVKETSKSPYVAENRPLTLMKMAPLKDKPTPLLVQPDDMPTNVVISKLA